MKDESDAKITTKLVGLSRSYPLMTVVKIKNQKAQKGVSSKENVNLKIMI